MSTDLGSQVSYGVGKEVTAGTGVAATYWLNQLSFAMNPVVTYTDNTAAWGVLEKANDSIITSQYAKGTLNGKLTDESAGLILLGSFGSVSSVANADASGDVYDHTFTINQDIDGQSLTFVRKDSLSTMAYAMSRIDKWALSMKLKDYVQYNADVLAMVGSSTTASVVYVAENEFVPKHISVKTASSASGLSAASAVSTVDSFTLTVNPNLSTSDFAAGSNDPFSFSSQGYDLSFEMECRYNDTTYEDAYKNNTPLALEVSASNSDVTIGTSANPGLTFTAYKMYITDWARSEDLNKPLTQKMTGTIYYSSADAKAIQAVLTNLVTSY